jgi:LCP family protein required for cell wall assembly
MGIDRRPGEPFISRTDTMMLMSLDPINDTASILSIPRDLYVVIPGRGRDRINTAFVYGSAGNNPAGGAQLAMQTVEYNLGVPVHHYMLVDFSAVVGGIDAIGGIDLFVPYNIYDPNFPDMNYGYDPLYIQAGQQHFDGTTALKYARTRHQDNDFYRASRQQQVVLAVRDKVLGLGFTEMIRQAPRMYQQLEQGVKTDLSLEQMASLAKSAADIPNENIRNEVLDQTYVSGYRTPAGASVLVPINERITPLIQEMFYS